MTYVRVKDKDYLAEIYGKVIDYDWDNRESKAIVFQTTYEQAKALFQNGAAWSIVDIDDEGTEIVYDNSDFCVAGDIVDHRDGMITVKMGRMTPLEEAYELLYGGLE